MTLNEQHPHTFVEGIKALADSIEADYPGRVGEPVEQEWYTTTNGEDGVVRKKATQYTTTGYFEHCFWLNRTYFFEDKSADWEGE